MKRALYGALVERRRRLRERFRMERAATGQRGLGLPSGLVGIDTADLAGWPRSEVIGSGGASSWDG